MRGVGECFDRPDTADGIVDIGGTRTAGDRDTDIDMRPGFGR